MVRKAIIPAAGLGTRFLPATKAIPKEMMPIFDKPTIQLIVEEAVASGIDDILIVTARGKESIENHFDRAYELEELLKQKGKADLLRKVQSSNSMANIHYIRQKNPLGLGHAIWCARTFVQNEPFAVLLGDTFFEAEHPALKQLIDAFGRCHSSVLGIQQVDPTEVNKFGIVDGVQVEQGLYRVNQLVEKPSIDDAPTNQAMVGRYILTPGIFKILESQKPGIGGEIQLTDAINKLRELEEVYASEVKGVWHDVGDPLGMFKTLTALSKNREELKSVRQKNRKDDGKGGWQI